MTQDYKHDLGLNKINTMLELLEKNPNRTEEEINKARSNYNLIIGFKEYSEDVLKDFEDRFNNLSPYELDVAPDDEISEPIMADDSGDIQYLKDISPRHSKVNHKKLRTAVAAIAAGTVLVVAGYSLASCGSKKVKTPVVKVAEVQQPIVEEKVEFTEMSEETKEYSDGIVLSMNDAISKGFEITDNNKEIIAKKFVNYMNIINMDELTAEQWKIIYQDGNVTAKDMMYDLFDIETIFEKIITVSENESEAIDFSLYFNEVDAGLLNKAEHMIIKINTSTGNDRKTAIKEMHDYIIETLTITENRMQYSEVALNTFRGVFVNAFDVLSNGKSITDEEEHNIFTVSTHCMGNYDNNLNVEDQTINSLQSKFEIYMVEKIDTMLNRELDVEVNPYDSIDEMSKYIAGKIDLSLYKPAKDYEAYQEKLFLNTNNKPVTVKAKNDSGVSDGKGGVISSEQFAQYGIDPNSPTAKTQLESAVKAEYEANAEKNKTTHDLDGTVVDPELLRKYTQQGADDYNYRRGNNKASIETKYQDAYQNGWDSAKALEDELKNSLSNPGTTYVPTDNGGSTVVNETVIEQPYTGDVPQVTEEPVVVPETPSEPIITIEEQPYIEEFVPVEEFVPAEATTTIETSEETTTSETYEEVNYTASIKRLEQLKQELFDLSSIYTDEQTHQKC